MMPENFSKAPSKEVSGSAGASSTAPETGPVPALAIKEQQQRMQAINTRVEELRRRQNEPGGLSVEEQAVLASLDNDLKTLQADFEQSANRVAVEAAKREAGRLEFQKLIGEWKAKTASPELSSEGEEAINRELGELIEIAREEAEKDEADQQMLAELLNLQGRAADLLARVDELRESIRQGETSGEEPSEPEVKAPETKLAYEMRELGYLDIDPREIFALLEDQDKWALNILFLEGNIGDAQALIKEKLSTLKERLPAAEQEILERQMSRIIGTGQPADGGVLGIMQGKLEREILKQLEAEKATGWKKYGKMAKSFLINGSIAVGTGLGVGVLVGSTIATGGGTLAALAPFIAAGGTGGILSLGKTLYHKFSQRDATRLEKDLAQARQQLLEQYQSELRQAGQRGDYQAEVGVIKNKGELAALMSNQIREATGQAVLDQWLAKPEHRDLAAKLKGGGTIAGTTGLEEERDREVVRLVAEAEGDVQPDNEEQQLDQTLPGLSPELYKIALKELEVKYAGQAVPPEQLQKMALLQTKILLQHYQGSAASFRSLEQLSRSNPRLVRALGKLMEYRSGQHKETKGAQIAGTALLGSAVSVGLNMASQGGFRWAGTVLAGLMGAGAGYLMGREKALAREQYQAVEEVEKILAETESLIVDVHFPEGADELRKAQEAAKIVAARLNARFILPSGQEAGLLDIDPLLRQRAQNFVYNIEKLTADWEEQSLVQIKKKFAEEWRQMAEHNKAEAARIEQEIKKGAWKGAAWNCAQGMALALAGVKAGELFREHVLHQGIAQAKTLEEPKDTIVEKDVAIADTEKTVGTDEALGTTSEIKDTAGKAGHALSPGELLKVATIQREDGIEHSFIRQLEHQPELGKGAPVVDAANLKFDDQGKLILDNAEALALHHWAGLEAHRLASQAGYVDKEAEVWVREGAAYVLAKQGGGLKVTEYYNGKEIETHALSPGQPLEEDLEKYEMFHPRAGRGAKPAGGAAAETPTPAAADTGEKLPAVPPKIPSEELPAKPPEGHPPVSEAAAPGTEEPREAVPPETEPPSIDLETLKSPDQHPQTKLDESLISTAIKDQAARCRAEHPAWFEDGGNVPREIEPADGGAKFSLDTIEIDGQETPAFIRPVAGDETGAQYEVDLSGDGRADAVIEVKDTDNDGKYDEANLEKWIFNDPEGKRGPIVVNLSEAGKAENNLAILAKELGYEYSKIGDKIRYLGGGPGEPLRLEINQSIKLLKPNTSIQTFTPFLPIGVVGASSQEGVIVFSEDGSKAVFILEQVDTHQIRPYLLENVQNKPLATIVNEFQNRCSELEYLPSAPLAKLDLYLEEAKILSEPPGVKSEAPPPPPDSPGAHRDEAPEEEAAKTPVHHEVPSVPEDGSDGARALDQAVQKFTADKNWLEDKAITILANGFNKEGGQVTITKFMGPLGQSYDPELTPSQNLIKAVALDLNDLARKGDLDSLTDPAMDPDILESIYKPVLKALVDDAELVDDAKLDEKSLAALKYLQMQVEAMESSPEVMEPIQEKESSEKAEVHQPETLSEASAVRELKLVELPIKHEAVLAVSGEDIASFDRSTRGQAECAFAGLKQMLEFAQGLKQRQGRAAEMHQFIGEMHAKMAQREFVENQDELAVLVEKGIVTRRVEDFGRGFQITYSNVSLDQAKGLISGEITDTATNQTTEFSINLPQGQNIESYLEKAVQSSQSSLERADAALAELEEGAAEWEKEKALLEEQLKAIDVNEVKQMISQQAPIFEELNKNTAALDTFNDPLKSFDQKIAALKGVIRDGERVREFGPYDLGRQGDKIYLMTGEKEAVELTPENINQIIELAKQARAAVNRP